MVKIHHYSEAKFRSFSGQKQSNAILEMLAAIERNITDIAVTNLLIEHLAECLGWVSNSAATLPLFPDFSPLYQLKASLSPHQIISLITPVLDTYQRQRTDNDFAITRYDGADKQLYLKYQNPIPVYAVLDNLRSAYNVGAIFRIAECFNLQKLFLCGITPTPDNNKVKMTAMGTEKYVPWQYCPTTQEAILYLKEQRIDIIALETAENSIILNNFIPNKPLAVILGNEALGIDPDIIKYVDTIVTIPIFGIKNSLNVSTAFAIAAYSIMASKENQ